MLPSACFAWSDLGIQADVETAPSTPSRWGTPGTDPKVLFGTVHAF